MNYRAAYILTAVLVALIVMMIGKSCNKDTNVKKNSSVSEESYVPQYQYTPDDSILYQQIPDSNSYQQNVQQTETAEIPTETMPAVEYITNEAGEIVDVVLAEQGNEETVTAAENSTKSMLEEYNENRKSRKSEETAETPTEPTSEYQLPSSIRITIN